MVASVHESYVHLGSEAAHVVHDSDNRVARRARAVDQSARVDQSERRERERCPVGREPWAIAGDTSAFILKGNCEGWHVWLDSAE